MSLEQQRPPLWEVMLSASEEARMGPPGSDYAAKIRAVRDWLVPDENVEDAPGRFVNGCCLEERQRLRSLLTSEAERAEVGG